MPVWVVDVLWTVARYLVVAVLGKLALLGVPAEVLEKIVPHTGEIATFLVGVVTIIAVRVQLKARKFALTAQALPAAVTAEEVKATMRAGLAPPLTTPPNAVPALAPAAGAGATPTEPKD